MIIGKLRQRVEILRLNETKDSFGAVTGEWVAVNKIWADIQIKTGSEYMAGRQVQEELKVEIVIRYITDITSKDRIKHNDSIYEILSVINEDMKYTTLKLICKEVK